MASNIAELLADLSPEELEALLKQATASKAKPPSASELRKRMYGENLTSMVTQVIEGEEYVAPEGKDWAGYKVYGIPVVVEGHTFTVSVTITDTEAKAARERARKVQEAKALLEESPEE